MANSDLFLGIKNMVAAKLGASDIKLALGSKLVYPLNNKTDIQDAVVTCGSATYNGSNQVATNITVTLSGVTLVENTDYTVTQNTGGTNAGSYSVTVSGSGDYEGTASGIFTINKVTPTVTAPTPKVLTYNGSAQELVTAGSTNFGTLKYKVGSDSWSTSIPTRTRGGSYTVYYKVVGDSNINDVASASTQCSINEKPVTATVTLSQSTYTYNGSACQPTPTVKDGTTVIDPSEYTVTYSNNINAGTATVTIYDVVGGDYYVEGSTTFTINKADTTYTAPTANNRTYDATSKALLNAGSVTGGTIQYSSDNSTWSTTIPTGTNANTYTTYWRIVGDSNHNDKASASISTTINKANSSLSFAVTNLYVGVGETKTNTVTVNAGDGTVTYNSNNTSEVTVDNSGVVSGVSFGDAVITANISQTNNYNSASTNYTASCKNAIVAKLNITNTTSPTKVVNYSSGLSAIEIDGVVKPIVSTGYTFSTIGEHTVKYILKDASCINTSDFYNCNSITSITIPDSVTSIGNSAFEYCLGLTSVDIPDSVTSIGQYAFYGCRSLTSIDIPSGVTSIGDNAFRGCSGLTTCTIGSGVTSIGNQAFSGCTSLTRIVIPDSVTSIGNSAFTYCTSLTSCTIGSGVTSIGNEVFYNCYSLTSCTIGSGVTSIGSNAFGYCSGLTSIDIPDSVTSIGGGAFYSCSGLTSIDIPSGVTSIGDRAFRNCSGLTSITVNAITPPTMTGSNTFYGTNNCPIYVPCNSVDTYKAASGWNGYSSRIQPIAGTCT